MLGSIVELLGCLLLSAPIFLLGSCAMGSIVVALRAVGPGSKENKSGRTEGRPDCRGGLPISGPLNELDEAVALAISQSVAREPRRTQYWNKS